MTGPLHLVNKTTEDVADYVEANAEAGNPVSVLKTIDNWTSETGEFLMNVGPKKGQHVAQLLQQRKPQRVLEIGTFIGYSAVLIGSNIEDDARLVSVDINPSSVAQRIANHAGLEKKIKFVQGTVEGTIFVQPFDFVFIDHAKDRYFPDLQLLEQRGLLAENALVVADNVGIFGEAMDGYFDHVRNSGLYDSYTIDSSLEYRDDVYDAIEVSALK